jgi:hypothetical protein
MILTVKTNNFIICLVTLKNCDAKHGAHQQLRSDIGYW